MGDALALSSLALTETALPSLQAQVCFESRIPPSCSRALLQALVNVLWPQKGDASLGVVLLLDPLTLSWKALGPPLWLCFPVLPLPSLWGPCPPCGHVPACVLLPVAESDHPVGWAAKSVSQGEHRLSQTTCSRPAPLPFSYPP